MADSELKKEYALSDTENEKKRLQEQSRIIMQTTRRIFELARIEKGMKVLELGTGVGDVTLLLAEMIREISKMGRHKLLDELAGIDTTYALIDSFAKVLRQVRTQYKLGKGGYHNDI